MSDYFAAANSAHGFVSWFDDIFAPETLGRTYILKGGSGTGKSTLMKRAAARCEEAGGEVERFRCSSDAASLDGVILRLGGDSAAILDGTAPHLRDPRYPGAAVCGKRAIWPRWMRTATLPSWGGKSAF